jgi:hypothetical protein
MRTPRTGSLLKKPAGASDVCANSFPPSGANINFVVVNGSANVSKLRAAHRSYLNRRATRATRPRTSKTPPNTTISAHNITFDGSLAAMRSQDTCYALFAPRTRESSCNGRKHGHLTASANGVAGANQVAALRRSRERVGASRGESVAGCGARAAAHFGV